MILIPASDSEKVLEELIPTIKNGQIKKREIV